MSEKVKCPRRVRNRHERKGHHHPDWNCALCNALSGEVEISAALAGAYMLLIENGKHPATETVKRLRREFKD